MADFNERDLITRCLAGDEAAFTQLVEQYQGLVFGVLSRTVTDRGRVEDLAQEVFLRVYRGLPHFRADSRLSTWIYRIAANLCAQERVPKGVHEIPLDDDSPGPALRTAGTRDRTFGEIELRDRLDKAMARLPVRYRLLIAGHYFKEIQYEDLADVLELPIGTVKTHLHRAKRMLRRLLEEEL